MQSMYIVQTCSRTVSCEVLRFLTSMSWKPGDITRNLRKFSTLVGFHAEMSSLIVTHCNFRPSVRTLVPLSLYSAICSILSIHPPQSLFISPTTTSYRILFRPKFEKEWLNGQFAKRSYRFNNEFVMNFRVC
jgi:hypothetical protein